MNCIVYLARKERWHVIKIRALVIIVIIYFRSLHNAVEFLCQTYIDQWKNRWYWQTDITLFHIYKFEINLYIILQFPALLLHSSLFKMSSSYSHSLVMFLLTYFVHYSNDLSILLPSTLVTVCDSLPLCMTVMLPYPLSLLLLFLDIFLWKIISTKVLQPL